MAGFRIGLQLSADVETTRVRQFDIENDQSWLSLAGDTDRLGARARLDDFKSRASQHSAHGVPSPVMIVDVEDDRCRKGVPNQNSRYGATARRRRSLMHMG